MNNKMKELTVSSSIIKLIYQNLLAHGLSTEEFERESGILEDELNINDNRFEIKRIKNLDYIVGKYGNDPAFSLHMAEKSNPESLGIVGYIVKNCNTILELSKQFKRFYKLIGENIELNYIIDKNHVFYKFNFVKNVEYQISAMEFILAGSVIFKNKLSGKKIIPILIKCQHNEPDYLEEYERIFKCPVLFNQNETEIIFNKEILNYNVINSSSYLKDILVTKAENLLTHIDVNKKITLEVGKMIKEHLHFGEVSIENIAEKLNMSRHTLYRKLKKEGTTFKAELDSIRKNLSVLYLNENKYSSIETAFLLGYSESSSFNKAFKNWYNTTPSNYNSCI